MSQSKTGRPSRVRLARAIGALAAVALLLVCAWPGDAPPRRFPDSVGYIQWPQIQLSASESVPSRRPPAYPMTLDLLGTGAGLHHAQTWLSLASFGLLGWGLAGLPGLLLAGALSRAGAIAPWNGAVLTESLTLSGLALLAAISLRLARHARPAANGTPGRGRFAGLVPAADVGHSPSLGWMLAWAGLGLYLAMLRDANFLALPVLALPFLAQSWRRATTALLFLLLLATISTVTSAREGRWQVPYYTAIVTRVTLDREARAAFREAGMPALRRGPISQEMRDWLDHGGRRLYERWVLTRPASYRHVWQRLRQPEAGSHIRGRYFADAPAPAWAERTGDIVWWLMGPPAWLWLTLVFVPALEIRLRGGVSPLGAMAALLVPATYALAFVSFHAAGTEEVRHLLAPALLYRIAFAFGLAALLAPASGPLAEPLASLWHWAARSEGC